MGVYVIDTGSSEIYAIADSEVEAAEAAVAVGYGVKYAEHYSDDDSDIPDGAEVVGGSYRANVKADSLEAMEALPVMNIRGDDARDDNNARASFAALALTTYAKRVGDTTTEEALGDLLADLMHLCDAAGEDFGEHLRTARRRYDKEVSGRM